MTTAPERLQLRRRLEPGRLLFGSLLEMVIKAYGAGAALSVAMSDAETVGGKGRDALAAVPNLSEEYRNAQYVVDHQEEIRSAVDHISQHTPPESELREAADRATGTLSGIETTYDEVLRATDDVSTFPPDPLEALGHLRGAWDAKPDLDSIRQLAELADQVSPLADQVEVLIPVYYGGLYAVMDNFADDEIAATIGVMAVAFGISVVLGQAVGFWVRRGRPGLIAQALQRLGARVFRGWYVENAPLVLSPPLYDAAREHLQRDIVADPEGTLDPETLRSLERHFADRRSPHSTE